MLVSLFQLSTLLALLLLDIPSSSTPHHFHHPSHDRRTAISLSHTPEHRERVRRAFSPSSTIESRSLDTSWLLREAAKVDGKYNNGDSGYAALLAAAAAEGQESRWECGLDGP